jgi:hypothetical protein
MTTEVSEYELTQNLHSRCLWKNMQAVRTMKMVFEYAVTPVRLTAKSEDSHNMEDPGCHINYIILQKLDSITYFFKFKLIHNLCKIRRFHND